MLFPLFVVVTLLEIYVLVSVGDAIGGFSTVLLVVITALIGSSLLKHQGWSTMAKAQKSMAEGKTPALEMMEGVVILVSGVMLLTPGFITDTIGLLDSYLGRERISLIIFSRKMLLECLSKEALCLYIENVKCRLTKNKKKKMMLSKVNFGKIKIA